MVTVPLTRVVTGMVKLGLVITAHRSVSLVTLTDQKQSQQAFSEAFHSWSGVSHRTGSLPPPSLLISAPLQKCAIFLWRVFELTATGPGMVMLGYSLLSSAPPLAAAQPSAAGRCRLMIGASVQ